MKEILENEPLVSEIQYTGVFDPFSLDELREKQDEYLLAIAVKIGDTRLIDNIIIE